MPTKTLNSDPSIWSGAEEKPQLIYAHTSNNEIPFDSSINHLIIFKQTLYITVESQIIETDDPSETKINEVIKFYFKDLQLKRNVCELQTDKLSYNVVFLADDLSPTDSIIIVMTSLDGETKTPRLLKFT